MLGPLILGLCVYNQAAIAAQHARYHRFGRLAFSARKNEGHQGHGGQEVMPDHSDFPFDVQAELARTSVGDAMQCALSVSWELPTSHAQSLQMRAESQLLVNGVGAKDAFSGGFLAAKDV